MQLKPAQVATSGLSEPLLIDFSVLWSGHRLIASAAGEVASTETGIDRLCLMAPILKCDWVQCVFVCHSVSQMVLKQIKSSYGD